MFDDVIFVGREKNSKEVAACLNLNTNLANNPPPVGSIIDAEDMDGNPLEPVKVVQWHYKVTRRKLDVCRVELQVMLDTI